MAKDKDKDEKEEKPKKGKKKGGPQNSLFLLVILGSMILFKETTLLIIAGMMPAIVAFVIDRRPQKYAAMSILILNVCGVLPFVFELWEVGHTMSNAIGILVKPTTLLVMWGAAFLGWLLTQVTPPFIGMILDVQRDESIRRQKKRQKALIKEWGDEVSVEASQLINLQSEDDDEEEDDKMLPTPRKI